ncbi:LOW QUALITY PROTEIN: hypothetical protein M8C21_009618, partial [Ambrosia artemisiifolia]
IGVEEEVVNDFATTHVVYIPIHTTNAQLLVIWMLMKNCGVLGVEVKVYVKLILKVIDERDERVNLRRKVYIYNDRSEELNLVTIERDETKKYNMGSLFNFDDERVTKEDKKRALEEQYGDEEESSNSVLDDFLEIVVENLRIKHSKGRSNTTQPTLTHLGLRNSRSIMFPSMSMSMVVVCRVILDLWLVGNEASHPCGGPFTTQLARSYDFLTDDDLTSLKPTMLIDRVMFEHMRFGMYFKDLGWRFINGDGQPWIPPEEREKADYWVSPKPEPQADVGDIPPLDDLRACNDRHDARLARLWAFLDDF